MGVQLDDWGLAGSAGNFIATSKTGDDGVLDEQHGAEGEGGEAARSSTMVTLHVHVLGYLEVALLSGLRKQ